MPLDIQFERVDHPQTFAHIWSRDGVLGHAQEFRERVPEGTLVTIARQHHPTLTTYLVRRCGCEYLGYLRGPEGFVHLVRRVN